MKAKTVWPKPREDKDRWESKWFPGQVYLNHDCDLRWVNVCGKAIDMTEVSRCRKLIGDE